MRAKNWGRKKRAESPVLPLFCLEREKATVDEKGFVRSY